MYRFQHFYDMFFVHCTDLACTFLIAVVSVTKSVFETYSKRLGFTMVFLFVSIFAAFTDSDCPGTYGGSTDALAREGIRGLDVSELSGNHQQMPSPL